MPEVTPTFAQGPAGREPVQTAANRRGVFLAAGVIVLMAWAAYANTFSAPFVYDDLKSIAQNPTIHHAWPPGAALSPPAGGGLSGRPLVNLSFALNYAAGGESVRGYHMVNLAIHMLAALTLFGLVRRTLLRPTLGEALRASALPVAWGVATFWVLHPLQTEAVTYVSQRTEEMMGLCYLLTVYAFARATASESPGKWLTLSVVACWLGVMCKEVIMTAPLIVLLYDRTFVAGTFRAAWTQRWRYYLALAGSWLFLGCLMRDLAQRHVGFGMGVSGWSYALTECRAIVLYLRLAVWPYPLVFDYGAELAKFSAGAVACGVLVILLAAVTVIALRRRPMLGFVGAWFFVILAPTSSVMPIALQPIAEHRMYLPLAGVAVLGVLGLRAWIGRWSTAVVLVVAMGLGVVTFARNETYRSELDLWSDTVSQRPGNARAQTSLGTALALSGRPDEAREHFAAAVRLAPDDARARYNLANVLLELDRPAEALAHATAAARLAPQWADAHCVIGGALEGMGRLDEAEAQFEEALRLEPGSATARNNLAQLRALRRKPPSR